MAIYKDKKCSFCGKPITKDAMVTTGVGDDMKHYHQKCFIKFKAKENGPVQKEETTEEKTSEEVKSSGVDTGKPEDDINAEATIEDKKVKSVKQKK
jgi:hypothetical protein